MPRTTKPAALKLLEGRGPGVDSGGRPVKPPPPFPRCAPDKPTDMSTEADQVWDAMVTALEPVELLKPLDEFAMRTACETYARWRAAVAERERKGMTVVNAAGTEVIAPWVVVEERAGQQFRAWCNEFGLTPAAETKVALDVKTRTPEGDNPFAVGL